MQLTLIIHMVSSSAMFWVVLPDWKSCDITDELQSFCLTNNWMAPGKNHVTAISTEIFKYVRIHPNFVSRPVWFEKMFLCCFFLKAGRKDLTNRPEVHFQPPPPPPNYPFPPGKCWSWIHEIWETLCYTAKNSGMGGGGGGWEERTLGLFVKSFLPAFREKQHRNIFLHPTGRLVKFGWIVTYLKISVEMAVTWFLPDPFNYCLPDLAEWAHLYLNWICKSQNFIMHWSSPEEVPHIK